MLATERTLRPSAAEDARARLPGSGHRPHAPRPRGRVLVGWARPAVSPVSCWGPCCRSESPRGSSQGMRTEQAGVGERPSESRSRCGGGAGRAAGALTARCRALSVTGHLDHGRAGDERRSGCVCACVQVLRVQAGRGTRKGPGRALRQEGGKQEGRQESPGSSRPRGHGMSRCMRGRGPRLSPTWLCR